MNMQAMLKQAQALQKDMLKAKSEIDNTDFVGENAMVKITMKGTKDVSSVEMKVDQLEKDDMEMLEEMIKSAINDENKKIDDATEKKMGKFGNIPGLF